MLVIYAQQMPLLRSNSITRMLHESAQRSIVGKKIWLSMHPRNLGSYKIVRTFVDPFMLADVTFTALESKVVVYNLC